MKSRHLQAIAGIGLALGGSIAAPSVVSAQGIQNRVPDPNAKRVMIPVFKAGEKGLGVQASDALRSKITSDFPFKQVYVLPKTDLNATLEASGFSTTEALAAHDARALATLLRADEYLTGSAQKTPAGYKLEANLVLQRDNSLVQPLGVFEGGNLSAAATGVSRELKEARKQLEFEQKCVNAAREKKFDVATAAAKEGIAAYPKATLVRICLANVMLEQKAPNAEILALSREIVNIHPQSRSGLAILAQAYREANQQDSAVVTLTKLLATDPTNPRLAKDVVDAIASLANPRVARPVIDTVVALNPGDPELLRLRWLILMAVKDFKEAYAQGDELVRLDTAFADTTYFIRTSTAYANDSQPQKAAEFAARGLQKFPNQPSLLYSQIIALRGAGQNQQALDILDKAIAAKVPVENSNVLRITLLKDLDRGGEALPTVRAAIAAGDTSNLLRQMVVQAGNDGYKKARQTKAPADFDAALATLMYADSISAGQTKAQAQFLLGATYVEYGQVKLAAAQPAKSCQLAKDAKNYFVEAQIMLPKGGSFAPDAMRTYMGAVMQLDPTADQMIKAYCK